MDSLNSPLEIAALGAALAWPFAAGLGVVLWTRTRAAERQRRQAKLDAELGSMFRSLEQRPTPERLTLVIDALEEAEAMKPLAGASDKPLTAV